ncbi:MAG: hypothetical protein V4444_09000 [Pseudomonadota bacterium]
MTDSALIPFASLLAGGFLQFLFARVTAKENLRREMRRQLYASFVENFWKAATLKDNSPERDDVLRQHAQLSTHISLYCSPQVLMFLSRVLKRPSIENAADRESWKNLICAMRRDVGEKVDEQTKTSVNDILFERESANPL